MRLSVFLAALLLWPSIANACRELSPEAQFELSDTVIVGRISSVIIPELDSLQQGTTEIDALSRVVAGDRIFRIVVTETRKGTPITNLTVKVNRCTGASHGVGERVVAYQAHDDSWRVSGFVSELQERGP